MKGKRIGKRILAFTLSLLMSLSVITSDMSAIQAQAVEFERVSNFDGGEHPEYYGPKGESLGPKGDIYKEYIENGGAANYENDAAPEDGMIDEFFGHFESKTITVTVIDENSNVIEGATVYASKSFFEHDFSYDSTSRTYSASFVPVHIDGWTLHVKCFGYEDKTVSIADENEVSMTVTLNTAYVKVPVYVTDGIGSGEKDATVSNILKLPYKQNDGYYPVGLVSLPELLFAETTKNQITFINTEADFNAVMNAINDIDKSVLFDDSKDDHRGNGTANRENEVASHLFAVIPAYENSNSSYNTALIKWNHNDHTRNITLQGRGEYDYHLDLRFDSAVVNFVGIKEDDPTNPITLNSVYTLKNTTLPTDTAITTVNGYNVAGKFVNYYESNKAPFTFGSSIVTEDEMTIYVELSKETKTYYFETSDGADAVEVTAYADADKSAIIEAYHTAGNTDPNPDNKIFAGWTRKADTDTFKATYITIDCGANESVAYDGTDHSVLASATVSDGSTATIVIKDSSENVVSEVKNAGTYTVVASYTSGTKTITSSKTITVNPKAVSLVIADKEVTYGTEATAEYSSTFTGTVEGEAVSATPSYYVEDGKIKVNNISIGDVFGNYVVTEITEGTLTIVPKAVSVSGTFEKTYDGAGFEETVNVEGLVGDDVIEVTYATDETEASNTLYTVSASSVTDYDTSHYTLTVNNATLKINKKQITVTAKNQAIVKNQAFSTVIPEAEIDLEAVVNGDELQATASWNSDDDNFANTNGECKLSADTYKDAFIATLLGASASNYDPVFVNGSLTVYDSLNAKFYVLKPGMKIKKSEAANYGKTVTSQPSSLFVDYGVGKVDKKFDGLTVSEAYGLNGGAYGENGAENLVENYLTVTSVTFGDTYSLDGNTYKLLGVDWYTVKDTNGKGSWHVDGVGTWELQPKEVTGTVTKIYNGENQVEAVKNDLNGILSTNGLTAKSDYSFAKNGEAVTSITNAGEYTATVTVSYSANGFTSADYTIVLNVVVEKAKVSVTITGNSDTITFDGASHSIEGYTVFGTGDMYNEQLVEFTGESTKVTGTYANEYKQTMTASDFSYADANVDATFAVNNGLLKINKLGASMFKVDKQKLYDGEVFSYKYHVTVKLANPDKEVKLYFEYSSAEKNASDEKYHLTATPAYEYASERSNIPVADLEKIYASVSVSNLDNGYVKINKRPVTLTSEDDHKTYDGTALTKAGVTVTGPSVTVNNETKVLFGFVEGEATVEATGSVTHVAEGNVANTIEVTYLNGALASNYEITKNEGTLYIDALLVNTDDYSYEKEYDGEGLTETEVVETGVGTEYFTITCVTEEASVGEHTMTQTHNASADYDVTLGEASVNITKAPLSLSFDEEKTYDGKSFTKTVSVDGVNGESFDVTYSTAEKNVGSYTVAVDHEISANYSVSVEKAELKINPASIQIEAFEDSKVYDGKEYKITKTVAGVNDETYTVTYKTAEKNVGTYELEVSNNVSANYTVETGNATLDITPATITIADFADVKKYDGAGYEKTLSVNGVNGEAFFVTYKTSEVLVGTYDLTQTNTVSSNYTVVSGLATLEITNADIVVPAYVDEKVYDGKAYEATVEVEGVNGEKYTVTYATKETNVGTYELTVTDNISDQYSVAYGSASLTITPAALVIADMYENKIYDGLGFAKDVTINGVNGETYTVSYSTEEVNVGAYELDVKHNISNNYDVTDGGAVLSVAPASLAIADFSDIKKYDGEGYEKEVEVAGVNGETYTVKYSTSEVEVGTYDLEVEDSISENYEVTYGSATLVISDADIVVPAYNSTKVYDGKTFKDSITVEGVDGEKFTVKYSTSEKNAGTYELTVEDDITDNYTVEYGKATLVITKKDVVVTAQNASKTEGEADPTLSGSSEGVLKGDNLVFSYYRMNGEEVGTYDILVWYDEAEAANYNVTVNNGVFTINAAAIAVIPAIAPAPTVVTPAPVQAEEVEETPEVNAEATVEEAVETTEETTEAEETLPVEVEIQDEETARAEAPTELTIEDEETPLASKGRCRTHWFILLTALIYGVYASLRGLANKKALEAEDKETVNN